MSITCQFENLGIIRQAELTLGDLTIVCGKNNTGKTYATYAIYGFLHEWRSGEIFRRDRDLIPARLPPGLLSRLMQEGTFVVSIDEITKNLSTMLKDVSNQYSKTIHHHLAGSPRQFRDTKIEVAVGDDTDIKAGATIEEVVMGGAHHGFLEVRGIREKGIQVTLLMNKEGGETMSKEYVEDMLAYAIWEGVLKNLFPKPFIASAERTGAAIFQRALDPSHEQPTESSDRGNSKRASSGFYRPFAGYPGYPVPVRRNLHFIRDLPNIVKRESVFSKKHPHVLERFREIIGGDYKVTKDGAIRFIPHGSVGGLSITGSSSAVRSLLDVGLYLRHIAQPGDILIIDEPELNLHPENQRLIARLLATLVNCGIKVFATTHSDYIIRELNALVMLSAGGSRLEEIKENEGYEDIQLLSPCKLKVYIADSEKPCAESEKKRKGPPWQTMKSAVVDEKEGISLYSFDDTIEDMNRIQDEIYWDD